MDENNYLSLSLELHLFFDRIMKEHAIFIEASLPDKDKKIKRIANNFQMAFSNVLSKAINLANDNVSESFLTSNEMITKNTLVAEEKTTNLTGIKIQTDLTVKEQAIKARNQNSSVNIREVQSLNSQTIPILNNYISFQNQLLNEVLNCKIFTTNYPTMIKHLIEETKMYYEMLETVQRRQFISPQYLYQQELFWDDIMKEHAEFIRGLLDPSESNLISTANKFVNEYQDILNNNNQNLLSLTNQNIMTTTNFRNFKVAGEEGIITCKIKSIIIPLLADHVTREANHFLRILKTYQQNIIR